MKSSISTLLIASGLGISFASADTINKTVVNAYADSVADFIVSFPAPGVPDANGWNYGYYDLTADGGTGVPTDYDYATDFTQFTTGQTRGSGFGVATGGAPWTFVQPNNAGHPNGTNNVNEHWAIRRYTVPAAGVPAVVDLNWVHSVGGGANQGTTLNIYRNGANILSNSEQGSGGSGTISFTDIAPGDVIDFALTPEGPTGDRTDGSDGSVFGGSLGFTQTFETIGVIADTATEFSGVQGQNNWTYGYINTLANNQPTVGDAHGGIFNQYAGGDGAGAWDGSSQFWTGSAWDGNTASAQPWTTLDAVNSHPNGTNQPEEQWATKRWTVPAGEDGDLLIEFDLAKANNNGGTTLFVIHNGEVIGDVSSNGILSEDFIELFGVQVGDTIDIALSPLFAGNTTDGSDLSQFNATVHLLVPEPATGSLVGISVLLLAMRRRRR